MRHARGARALPWLPGFLLRAAGRLNYLRLAIALMVILVDLFCSSLSTV